MRPRYLLHPQVCRHPLRACLLGQEQEAADLKVEGFGGDRTHTRAVTGIAPISLGWLYLFAYNPQVCRPLCDLRGIEPRQSPGSTMRSPQGAADLKARVFPRRQAGSLPFALSPTKYVAATDPCWHGCSRLLLLDY